MFATSGTVVQEERQQASQADRNSCSASSRSSSSSSSGKRRSIYDDNFCGTFLTPTPKTFVPILNADDENDNNNNDIVVTDIDKFRVNRKNTPGSSFRAGRGQKTSRRRWMSSHRYNQATARCATTNRFSSADILFTLFSKLVFCVSILLAEFWAAAATITLCCFTPHVIRMTLAQLATSPSTPTDSSFSVPLQVQSDNLPTGVDFHTNYYDYENQLLLASPPPEPASFFNDRQQSIEISTPLSAASVAYDPAMENITLSYYNDNATHNLLSSPASFLSDFITSTAASVVSSHFELFNSDAASSIDLQNRSNSTTQSPFLSTPADVRNTADFSSAIASGALLLPTVAIAANSTVRWLLKAAAANSSSVINRSSSFNSSDFGEFGTFNAVSNESNDQQDNDPNSHTRADIKTLIVLSVFYGIISITAVVGNFFVIWIVATCRRMQSVTNYLLSNLALADMLIGALSIPFQFQAAVLQRWDLPPILCPVAPFVQSVTVTVSIISLTVIACDRYRAFIYPLKPRLETHTAYIIIPSMWVAGIICGLPQALALRVIDVPEIVDNVTNIALRTKPFCYPANIDLDLYKIYSVVIVVLQYFIPLIVIIFCYSRIGKVLWWDSALAPGEQHHTMLKPTASSININNHNNNTHAGNREEITTVQTTAFADNKARQHVRGRTSSGALTATTPLSTHVAAAEQQQQQHPLLIQTFTKKRQSKLPVVAVENSDDGCAVSFAQGGDNSAMPAFWAATINSNNINKDGNNGMRMSNLNSNASMRVTSEAGTSSKQLQIRQHQLQMQHSTRETNKRKVIKMLILVVSMFALCWVPLQTYNVLFLVWEDVNRLPNIMIIWLSINWLAMSNSSVNPIIYGIYNDRFRREFRKKLNQCFLCRKPPTSPIRNRTFLQTTVNNTNINGAGSGIVLGMGDRAAESSVAPPRFGVVLRAPDRPVDDGAAPAGGLSAAENEDEEVRGASLSHTPAVLAGNDGSSSPLLTNKLGNHISHENNGNKQQKYQVYNYEFRKTSPPSYADGEDDSLPSQIQPLPPSITVTPLLSTTTSIEESMNNPSSTNASFKSNRKSPNEKNSMPLKVSNRQHGKNKVLSSPKIGVHSKNGNTLAAVKRNENKIPKISIEDDFNLKDDEEDETGGFGQPYHSNRDARLRNDNTSTSSDRWPSKNL